MARQPDPTRPQVGLSACLGGQPVRYDGGDKYAPVCMEVIGRYVDWVPLCPEVAVGLGVPRPPIDLVQDGDRVRTFNRLDPGLDPTAALEAYAEQVAEAFPELCAYVFMSRSPSCALHSGRLYSTDDKVLSLSARGRYAERWCRQHPDLPAVEAADLDTPLAQAAFLCRVYLAHARRQKAPPNALPALEGLLRTLFPPYSAATIDETRALLCTIDLSDDRAVLSALCDLQARLTREPTAEPELPAFIQALLGAEAAGPEPDGGGS